MGFTNQERINANTNALQANVLDANPASQWYEKRFTFEFALPSTKVYTELASIPSAATLTQARSNASSNPTIIEDLSQNADAVRLTAVTGTNDFTWVAYDTYNDPSSTRIDNWLQPQAIPQSTGLPSTGYSIALYNGDPASGGTLITTTDGQTGSGVNASVGWIWNYALGMLLLAQDFFTQTGINKSTFDPYVIGFRYIGQTAGGGSGVIGGTISNTQIAYGTATDTIGGDPDFTFDSANDLLSVEKVKAQIIIEIRNETGSTIEAGAVVYVSGSHSSGRPLVNLADASDSTEMPSVAVVSNQLATGSNGYGILTGTLNGLNGSAGNTVFDQTLTTGDIGKTLYVSPTNAGRLTITKPTGSTELIQNVGRILDFAGGNAKIAVNNIGRSNDVPNSFSTTGEIDAGSLTVNSSYSFPTSDGSDGQVLVTDGSGNLTFQNQSAIQAVCDENISAGELVRYIDSTDGGTIGRIKKAVSSDTNSDDVFVAVSSATTGNSVSIILTGEAPITFTSIPSSNQNGLRVYLSSTDGRATLTPPTATGNIVVKLGTLTGADGSSLSPNVVFRPQFIAENG